VIRQERHRERYPKCCASGASLTHTRLVIQISIRILRFRSGSRRLETLRVHFERFARGRGGHR
jgi:hypothetical protein